MTRIKAHKKGAKMAPFLKPYLKSYGGLPFGLQARISLAGAIFLNR